jgi:hypothetical protein
MLQKQLGRSTTIFKAILLGIVGVLGALTCVIMGMICYFNWTQSQPYRHRYRTVYSILSALQQIRVAYVSLYLLSVVVSGSFSLKTIMSLRSRRNPAGVSYNIQTYDLALLTIVQDLVGWIVALIISMVLWTVLTIVFAAWNIQDLIVDWKASAALTWLASFSQALSCIFLLCIAKHVAWRNTPITERMLGTDVYANVAHQPQYTTPQVYNTDPNAQQAYHHQQAPTYNGAAMPVKP